MIFPTAPQLDRRALLTLASGLAGSLWLPRSAWSQATIEGNPFALGIASGSPTHDSVVIWTRIAGITSRQDTTVRWEVAHDDQFKQPVQTGQATASAALGHSVHVELTGLSPDRWYHYRFMVGNSVSSTGRTRTFPAAGANVKKLRLAYASCQHWEHGYYSAYRHMLDEDLDTVLEAK